VPVLLPKYTLWNAIMAMVGQDWQVCQVISDVTCHDTSWDLRVLPAIPQPPASTLAVPVSSGAPQAACLLIGPLLGIRTGTSPFPRYPLWQTSGTMGPRETTRRMTQQRSWQLSMIPR
jgi:hypothetical protein